MKKKIKTSQKRILYISLLILLAVIIMTIFVINNNKRLFETKKADSPQSIQDKIDDAQKKDNFIINDSPAKDESAPKTDEPVVICATDTTNDQTFNLSGDALVYGTAADSKSKTNPAGTYHAGSYFIFKCYNGMANITKTNGSPGGWIDPQSPYADSVSNSTQPPTPSTVSVDVMSLSNTVVNWSHEYPSTFVSKYAGYWNIPGNNLYLTFDCGYDYNNLASTIMDTLKSKNIKAVFFVAGDFMNDRPDLIQRMIVEGHIVGNHSYSHLNQPQNLGTSVDVITSDLQEWENKYFSIAGAKPSASYFRPPAGAVSERSMGLMSQLGYKTVMWGTAYNDWNTAAQPSNETAIELLRKYTTPGDIVLLHGISQTSTNILGQYIDEYISKGYSFKLLSL